MTLITLSSYLARMLISPREHERDSEKYRSIEKEIQNGNWGDIPPIWVTPNFLVNGIFCGIRSSEWSPTVKPLIIYNGHHRFDKALEHHLPVRAYVRYSPGNPSIPEEEKLVEDLPY